VRFVCFHPPALSARQQDKRNRAAPAHKLRHGSILAEFPPARKRIRGLALGICLAPDETAPFFGFEIRLGSGPRSGSFGRRHFSASGQWPRRHAHFPASRSLEGEPASRFPLPTLRRGDPPSLPPFPSPSFVIFIEDGEGPRGHTPLDSPQVRNEPANFARFGVARALGLSCNFGIAQPLTRPSSAIGPQPWRLMSRVNAIWIFA